MCVKVHDADALRPTHLGNRRCIGPRDGVIAAEHNGDRTSLRDFANLSVNGTVAVLQSPWVDERVTSIHSRECDEGLNSHLQRVQGAGLVLRLSNRPRAEPGARPVSNRIIKWGADNRDIRLASANLGHIFNPR